MQCERCGAVYLDDKIKREWTGSLVCFGAGTRNCWEPRHPQEWVKAPPAELSVQEARPRQLDDGTVSNVLPYVEGGYWYPGYAA